MMAALDVTKDYIALSSQNHLIVLAQSNGEICLDYLEIAANNQDQDKHPNTNLSWPYFTQCKFSLSGKYLSCCTTGKIVMVWETSNWTIIIKKKLSKRPIKVIFTKCENYVLVADKSGEVTRVSLQSEKSEFVLGHLSTVLDMTLSRDDKVLITADRDGKIRLSCYPNCYNIEMFLLAHNNFVSCMDITAKEDYLVTGGGDGKIILWNFKTGQIFDSVSLNEKETIIVRSIIVNDRMNVFAIAEKSNTVFCFKIIHGRLIKSNNISLMYPPIGIVCFEDDIVLIQENKHELVSHFRAEGDNKYQEISKIGAPYLNVLQQNISFEDPICLSHWGSEPW